MTAAVSRLTSKFSDVEFDDETDALFVLKRREQRIDEVRIAEYTPFPRTRANQTPRRGFTRDVSPLGMCLGVDLPERIGALLRIEVQRLDGQSIGATIGRVIWCKPSSDGRYWVGLDLLCEPDGVQSQWHRRFVKERV